MKKYEVSFTFDGVTYHAIIEAKNRVEARNKLLCAIEFTIKITSYSLQPTIITEKKENG